MDNFNSDWNDSLFVAGERINVQSPRDTRKLTVDECVWTLAHASRCVDGGCKWSECRRMKRIVRHVKNCENRGGDKCSICKQLLAVCCHHAKHCRKAECPVPFCANVKWKLEQTRTPCAPSVRRKVAATSIQELESRRQEGRVSRARETLRRFIETLKSPDTPDKRSQILRMLRANPSLVTALVKLRQLLARKRSVSQRKENTPTLPVCQRKKRCQRRRSNGHGQEQANEDARAEARPAEATGNSKEAACRRLIHACRCVDRDCRLPGCRRTKRVVRHANACQRRTGGGCAPCMRLVALCCRHARRCLEADCPVPFCFGIKQKLEARRRDATVEVMGDAARASSSS